MKKNKTKTKNQLNNPPWAPGRLLGRHEIPTAARDEGMEPLSGFQWSVAGFTGRGDGLIKKDEKPFNLFQPIHPGISKGCQLEVLRNNNYLRIKACKKHRPEILGNSESFLSGVTGVWREKTAET